MPKFFDDWIINWAVIVLPLMQALYQAVLPLVSLAFRSISYCWTRLWSHFQIVL